MALLYEELTERILAAFYTVYNELGYGFLEKVYENALCAELEAMGIKVESQKPVAVYYKDKVVGEYFADLIVSNKVIIELKAAEAISEGHGKQLINYLKATGIEVGLLLNFGKKPEFMRKIYQSSNPSKSV